MKSYGLIHKVWMLCREVTFFKSALFEFGF